MLRDSDNEKWDWDCNELWALFGEGTKAKEERVKEEKAKLEQRKRKVGREIRTHVYGAVSLKTDFTTERRQNYVKI